MKIIVAVLALLLISGCTHVFSDEANRLVDPSVTFTDLMKNTSPYSGKIVKLGGIIASTKNTKEGSQLEIVQFKLDSGDMPDESYASGGRFLAVTPDFLDGMVYKTGRPVAVVGEVKGMKTLPLDEIDYSYPVISIKEIHVWNESDLYRYPPSYHYDPFYYPYWWYGPPYWYPYGHRFRNW